MKLLDLFITCLLDETIAVITYAMDEYEPEDLDMSPDFKFCYNLIKDKFNAAYIERKLDYSQFEADYRQVCPHCGKELEDETG